MLLRRLLGVEATAHGFRSSFRDWTAETDPGFPSEVAENMGFPTYRGQDGGRLPARRSGSEKRRALMDAWAAYLSGAVAAVVPLRRAQSE